MVQISFIASICSRIFLKRVCEDGAVALDLVLVPAAADAEQKPAARDLVDRGDELCGLDRVALDDEAHPGADLQGLRRHRRRGQGDERVHHVVVLLAEFAAAGRRRLARARDVRVLGRPERLEAARLERLAELGRGHRVIGEEHRRAKIHLLSPRIGDGPELTSARCWVEACDDSLRCRYTDPAEASSRVRI